MGLVAPIDKVYEIIRGNESLKKIRESEINSRRSEQAATADSVFPKPADDSETKRRLRAIMQGAFAGSPTQLKDISKRDGESRAKRKV
jgi:hypothetical protein